MNNKDTNKKPKTFAIQTSLADISSLKQQTRKNWQKKFIKISEKLVSKITKLPIKISTSTEQIMLNASAIFWYQDEDSKKFVMLKADGLSHEDAILQFPFVACLNKESVSATLETAVRDLFGTAFTKTLPIDCFASDKISSAPTVVVANESDEVQSILHNHVWVNQITPEQAELIQNHSEELNVVCVAEHQLTSSSVHEVHKFLYHSCIRHIHNIKFTDIPRVTESIEDLFSAHNSEQGKTLH